MRESSIKIGLFIIFTILVIWIIKNRKTIFDKYNKQYDKIKKIINKILKMKFLEFLFIELLIVCFIGLVFYYIGQYKKSFSISDTIQYEKYKYAITDEKIINEYKFVKEKIVTENVNDKYKNPYIPNGYSYVEGEYNTGFVIQDNNYNQFVWIPCTNLDGLEVPKLQKKNFVQSAFISANTCYDEEYEEFIISALDNGGYYISRYELGNENDVIVSKANVNVEKVLNSNQAKEVLKKYNSTKSENDLKISLINGFAYDTAYEWISETNDIQSQRYERDNDGNVKSGRNEYNHVFDFVDNIVEITAEISYDTRVVRGVVNNSTSIDLLNGNDFKNESRYTIIEDDRSDLLNNAYTIGIRGLLYK